MSEQQQIPPAKTGRGIHAGRSEMREIFDTIICNWSMGAGIVRDMTDPTWWTPLDDDADVFKEIEARERLAWWVRSAWPSLRSDLMALRESVRAVAQYPERSGPLLAIFVSTHEQQLAVIGWGLWDSRPMPTDMISHLFIEAGLIECQLFSPDDGDLNDWASDWFRRVLTGRPEGASAPPAAARPTEEGADDSGGPAHEHQPRRQRDRDDESGYTP